MAKQATKYQSLSPALNPQIFKMDESRTGCIGALDEAARFIC